MYYTAYNIYPSSNCCTLTRSLGQTNNINNASFLPYHNQFNLYNTDTS